MESQRLQEIAWAALLSASMASAQFTPDFQHISYAQGAVRDVQPEMADVDGDGLLDLLTPIQGGRVRVNPTGATDCVSSRAPYFVNMRPAGGAGLQVSAVQAVDYDFDGDEDILAILTPQPLAPSTLVWVSNQINDPTNADWAVPIDLTPVRVIAGNVHSFDVYRYDFTVFGPASGEEFLFAITTSNSSNQRVYLGLSFRGITASGSPPTPPVPPTFRVGSPIGAGARTNSLSAVITELVAGSGNPEVLVGHGYTPSNSGNRVVAQAIANPHTVTAGFGTPFPSSATFGPIATPANPATHIAFGDGNSDSQSDSIAFGSQGALQVFHAFSSPGGTTMVNPYATGTSTTYLPLANNPITSMFFLEVDSMVGDEFVWASSDPVLGDRFEFIDDTLNLAYSPLSAPGLVLGHAADVEAGIRRVVVGDLNQDGYDDFAGLQLSQHNLNVYASTPFGPVVSRNPGSWDSRITITSSVTTSTGLPRQRGAEAIGQSLMTATAGNPIGNFGLKFGKRTDVVSITAQTTYYSPTAAMALWVEVAPNNGAMITRPSIQGFPGAYLGTPTGAMIWSALSPTTPNNDTLTAIGPILPAAVSGTSFLYQAFVIDAPLPNGFLASELHEIQVQ